MNADLAAVIEALGAAADIEGDKIHAAAMRAGDALHAIVKEEAMKMLSVRCAVAVGIHAAVQMLCETLEFGQRSMEGGRDGELLTAAGLELFKTLVNDNLAGAFPKLH
jgi:hypothetical protein